MLDTLKLESKYLNKELKDNGYIIIPELINHFEIKNINKIVKKKSSDKNQTFTIALFNKKEKSLEIRHADSMNILNQIKNINLLTEEMKSVGDTSSLYRIDAYTSNISSEPVLPWHNDRAFSGDKTIHNKVQNKLFSYKAFIYLTNSDKKSGSLALLPKSHLVSSALRSLMRKNIIEYTPFWKLSDFFEIVKKDINKKHLISLKRFSNTFLKQFLKDAEYILLNPLTTKFDIAGVKGDCIIFDERGFHRGGIPVLNTRSVLRLFYLNGSGKFEEEPITEYGLAKKDSMLGEF